MQSILHQAVTKMYLEYLVQPLDMIDYLFGQAFGGVGRETLKLSSSIESLFTGEELLSIKYLWQVGSMGKLLARQE